MSKLKINHHLWRAIEESGLKRREIARRCGISPKKLAEIVRGIQPATAHLKNLLASELKQPWDLIFPEN